VPMVVFPEPLTPINTTIIHASQPIALYDTSPTTHKTSATTSFAGTGLQPRHNTVLPEDAALAAEGRFPSQKVHPQRLATKEATVPQTQA